LFTQSVKDSNSSEDNYSNRSSVSGRVLEKKINRNKLNKNRFDGIRSSVDSEGSINA